MHSTDQAQHKQSVMDDINHVSMRSQDALDTYLRWRGLKPAEQAAFDLISSDVRDQAILDIGVGGGRTVEAIRALSKNYIGVDYSPEMVSLCQKQFPDVDFRHADARDLSQFEDNSFSLVVFACEGICMVDHEGRLKIMSEVLRILKPNGIFVFSTFNQESHAHDRPFQFPDFEFSFNPVKTLVRALRFIKFTLLRYKNRRNNKKHDVRGKEYSIINDIFHHYTTMIYYISQKQQSMQLNNIGFATKPIVLDIAGTPVAQQTNDDTLTFIARKN